MKLRIKGNTLRLRLTKSEVDYFGNTLFIEEKTSFGSNVFSYSLKVNDQEKLSASFENNTLVVNLPMVMGKEWITTNKVGVSGEMDVENGKKLYLLIEKDFKCLDETVEDQSDNYENPLTEKKK